MADVAVHLEQTADGVLLPVRAQPRARKNGITGTHDGRLKVSVTQVPEKGKANTAIARVLARSLELKASQVALQSGPTASQKVFLIRGLSVAQLRQRLAQQLGE
jgi:uncharacterized protein (TIGR00251 family)